MKKIKIIVTARSNDYHAQIEGKNHWAAGRNPAEAIGDLVQSHPEKFGIEIDIKHYLPLGNSKRPVS